VVAALEPHGGFGHALASVEAAVLDTHLASSLNLG